MSGKQAAYHAIAQYYQSMVAKESKEFGEEIARLRVSHGVACSELSLLKLWLLLLV